MNNFYTLYMHTTPSNKRYIGITSDVNRRWKYKGYNYHTQIFYRAIQKYGWENIEHIVILDGLSYDWACQLERLYIMYYDTMNPKHGYNRTEGGGGVLGLIPSKETREKLSLKHSGYKHTDEARRKISEGLKNRSFSDEHRQNLRLAKLNQSEETRHKISEAHKKENMSDEYRQKLSNAAKGKVLSNETKEKLRQANLGKHHSEETKQKMREAHLGKKYKMRNPQFL